MRKLMLMILILPMVMVSQENESFLLNISEITVKQGHDAQFKAGVKSWKECYLENNGEDNWNIWKRIQGKGNVYAMTSAMANWAEMDEDGDTAGKECRTIVLNLIMPHVKSVHYNIAKSKPEVSRSTPMPEDTELVWVYNLQTNNSSDFKEVVSEISKTLKKVEGDGRGVWYSMVGGSPEVADYFIAIPYKNFAALDTDRDGVWKVYEKEHGKKKTDALRVKARASISKDWSYIYKLIKDLSH